ALSPDGRYLIYTSTESGRPEVYVRPFPNTGAARWQVSTAGGTEPRWAHSGREIFYRSGNGDLVVAAVTTTPTFSVGRQQSLFSAISFAALVLHQAYDVSPDDRRFIMLRTEAADQSTELILVQNWFTDLKGKAGR
ncbi:MAG: PD40 domain-containing protein, partial [Gemmatimonadetes bacterium]|nr:PD40 domain-containing protein [Gemmatimonadota bacterium]